MLRDVMRVMAVVMVLARGRSRPPTLLVKTVRPTGQEWLEHERGDAGPVLEGSMHPSPMSAYWDFFEAGAERVI
jgi:hypothetical protein